MNRVGSAVLALETSFPLTKGLFISAYNYNIPPSRRKRKEATNKSWKDLKAHETASVWIGRGGGKLFTPAVLDSGNGTTALTLDFKTCLQNILPTKEQDDLQKKWRTLLNDNQEHLEGVINVDK